MLFRLYKWLDTVFEDYSRVYLKRLAGNDTLLTGSHQAGPYIPNKIVFDLFPSLASSTELNPRVTIPVSIVSDAMPERTVTAIWYNNRVVTDGTRNECRITGWGGQDSPLLDPESTGSLVALTFKGPTGKDVYGCEVWVCSSLEEEAVFEDRFGPIEPGTWLYLKEHGSQIPLVLQPRQVQEDAERYDTLENQQGQLSFVLGRPVDQDCRLTSDQMPVGWLTDFPTGEAIIERAAEMRPDYASLAPDTRLLKRRDCEYEVFLSVEEAFILPEIERGFATVDAFVNLANSITNRRKARSGRSLELHVKRILEEERVSSFSHDAVSEGRKRPDFLFPSANAYHDLKFPSRKLRMLAAKTCCKDRWRQVADEAARIERKHLLTLQEGVSENQYAQMEKAGITLVVPKPLFRRYPAGLRPKLVSFSDFLAEVKNLNS